MRILVSASTFPRWPADTVPPFVHRLCMGLLQRGHDVYVLAPHYRGAAKREEMDGLHVVRFRYGPAGLETLAYGGGILENLRRHRARWFLVPIFMVAQIVALVRVVKSERIVLVHAHWLIPQGLVASLTRPVVGCPVVITAHGGDVFAMAKGWRRRLLAFAARSAEECTANSTVVRNLLERSTGVKATIIPMGVDLSAFKAPLDFRRRHLESPQRKILFVGRLVEKKGVRHLIEAMAILSRAGVAARLLIVGDGPERPALDSLVEALKLKGVVDFVGAVPNSDLPAYYAQADVFVAPSVISGEGDTEGLGVVILEAAACGVPIIASNIGGIGDIIQHERTGLLVEAGNAQTISSAIARLIDDDALGESLARNAHQLVAERYSWDVVAGQFDAMYRRIVQPQDGESV